MVAILNLPAGFCQSTLFYTGAAVPRGAAVTLGHRLDGVGQTPVGVAGVIAGAWGSSVYPSGSGWPTTLTLSRLLVKFGPLDTGPSAEVPINLTPGSGAGDAYAPNAAVLVSKNTAAGGRRGKGRMFLPCFPESSILAAGNILAASLTQLNTDLAELVATLETNDVPAFLLHRHDPALGQAPVAPTAITSLTAASLLATQRRRMRR